MNKSVFRIHPSIGIARVGTSKEYYLGPESEAGMPIAPGSSIMVGLPIKAGTENQMITSDDLRDAEGNMKRQAARFKIFAYDPTDKESYPRSDGKEISIGSKVDGKVVKKIVWTAHLANKKANSYIDKPIEKYENGKTPKIRNPDYGSSPNDKKRLIELMIDPGPRAIIGAKHNKKPETVSFDTTTTASYGNLNGTVTKLPKYPKRFPQDSFKGLSCPSGSIDTLGDLETDEQGRLLVLPGYGKACAWVNPETNKPYPLNKDVDNNGWFDDIGDGPVTAVLVFEDGKTCEVQGGGWVITTDPAYAPQTLNVVSLWDDIYNTWLMDLKLDKNIYNDGDFLSTYRPNFDTQINPIFQATALQQWNTNLPVYAARAHDQVGQIKETDKPQNTVLYDLETFIRNPNNPDE
jgi:hypothetical protein